ncbi:hypothetical protein [Nonomuraea polychroma]|nr:hypothetical protein [Nonomuraea polychroma]
MIARIRDGRPKWLYKESPAASHGLFASRQDRLNADRLDFVKR